MIDYTFGKPVADKLNELGAIKAKTTTEYGLPQHAEDTEIIKEISKKGYILLTHDLNTINERQYPPCSHGGIIIIMNRRWTEENIFENVKAFCLSGNRKYAKHCVTRIYGDKAIISKHDNETLEFDF